MRVFTYRSIRPLSGKCRAVVRLCPLWILCHRLGPVIPPGSESLDRRLSEWRASSLAMVGELFPTPLRATGMAMTAGLATALSAARHLRLIRSWSRC
jgi:hypothetical protein